MKLAECSSGRGVQIPPAPRQKLHSHQEPSLTKKFLDAAQGQN